MDSAITVSPCRSNRIIFTSRRAVYCSAGGLRAARARGRKDERPKRDQKKLQQALKLCDTKQYTVKGIEVSNDQPSAAPSIWPHLAVLKLMRLHNVLVRKEKEDKLMTIHIHPAENQDGFAILAMNLFMQAIAETILAEKDAAAQQHPA